VATLAELVAEHTKLDSAVVAHLQRLVAGWGVLSDLCFADLLLFAPVKSAVERFVVLGQVRPTTSQTLHLEDLVGRVLTPQDRPLLARAWHLGSVVEGEVAIPSRSEHARLVCIPVRWQGRLVALMTRESALSVGRRPGQLERVYIEVFDRLARMLSQGEFPYPVDEVVTGETPRVGDGVMVLDASARVDYASPNAVNALHRMGVYSGIEGVRLDEAGLDQSAVSLAYQTRLPSTEEIGDGGDTAVVLRCMPLLDNGAITGALVIMRDVSDLRRRDRLLLSKDAAIREVHHRVKNNLQTISSLLRLQSRRMPTGQPRHALEEAERRVRSIAVVHEILSRDTADEVDFNDILPSLVRMAEDLGRDDRAIRITYRGEAGELHASVATPLAVVITELLQNAAEHAWPDGVDGAGDAHGTVGADATGGVDGPDCAAPPTKDRTTSDPGRTLEVDVELFRTNAELRVTVRDNGVGLPPGFSVDDTSSLGLSIVRNLVGTQMGGTITMRSEGGTVVDVVIPVDHPADDLESL
jgi:two-component sensor histidine kinase